MSELNLLPILPNTNTSSACRPTCSHNHGVPQLTQLELPVLNTPHVHNHDCGCSHTHKTEAKPNKTFTPLMERIIKSKKLTANQKELLVTGSFLASALPVTKITGVLTRALGLNPFTSSLLTAPLAISSMHFVNRGNKNKDKLAMILASSLGGISLQNAFGLPKTILRTLLTTAVFFIEKYRPDNIQTTEFAIQQTPHEHGPNCNHGDLPSVEQTRKTKLKKEDFLRLGKTLTAILSVPALLNIPLHAITEVVDNQTSNLNKFLGHIGLTTAQIAGLTLGFFGFGKAINYGTDKLGFSSNAKVTNHTHHHSNNHTHNNHNHSTHGQTEGAVEVCAHCGVPGCIDSVTESITESVESSIVFNLFS